MVTEDPTAAFAAKLRATHDAEMAESRARFERSRGRSVSRLALIAAIVGPAVFVQQLVKTPASSFTAFDAGCWLAVASGGLATVVCARALERAGVAWPRAFSPLDLACRLALACAALGAGLAVSQSVRAAHGVTAVAASLAALCAGASIALGVWSARHIAARATVPPLGVTMRRGLS